METNEQTIIDAIKKGDADAFKEVYRRYYKPLCQFVYKYFEDSHLAEDIVQETLVGIWENHQKLSITNIKTYLFSSVKNACLNKIKHEKVVQKYMDLNLYELRILELESDTLFLESEDYENIRQVDALLNSLPEQRRKIMGMKYIDGLTAKEIAEITATSQRTVETHIYKGMRTLQQLFRKPMIVFFTIFCIEAVRIFIKNIVFTI